MSEPGNLPATKSELDDLTIHVLQNRQRVVSALRRLFRVTALMVAVVLVVAAGGGYLIHQNRVLAQRIQRQRLEVLHDQCLQTNARRVATTAMLRASIKRLKTLPGHTAKQNAIWDETEQFVILLIDALDPKQSCIALH